MPADSPDPLMAEIDRAFSALLKKKTLDEDDSRKITLLTSACKWVSVKNKIADPAWGSELQD